MADPAENSKKKTLFDTKFSFKTEMSDARDTYSELEPEDGELIKGNITDFSLMIEPDGIRRDLEIKSDDIRQDLEIKSDDSTQREITVDDTGQLEGRELCHFTVTRASLKTELEYSSMISESVGTEPGYNIHVQCESYVGNKPGYSIPPKSSIAYIIPPVSFEPYTELGNDSSISGDSVKKNPMSNAQTYYVSGVEQREVTLSESIVAKPFIKNEPGENTYRQISVVNIDPGEVTLNDLIVADPSIRKQLDENKHADIGPREKTLHESLIAKPSIKIETDMDDSLLGQHSESLLGPGEEIQETYDEFGESVSSKKRETDPCNGSDSTHREASVAHLESGERCLGESTVTRSSMKKEPEVCNPKESSIAKRPVTRCVTLIIPDNAKRGLNSSPVIPVQKHHMCSICGKWFSKDRTLQRHQRLYHNKFHSRNVKSLTCGICSKSFREKGDLILHIKTHGEKDLQRRKKSNDKKKPPEIKTSKNASHRKSKGSKCRKKLHACDFCDKVFKTAVAVRQHLQVHSDAKPYQCSDCGKSFKRQSHLQTHSTIHSGERPHKCRLCDWSFTDRSGLLRHQVVHTGEKPFKCDVCGNSFSRNETLQKHSLTHMVKQFNCDTCGKSFNRLVTLQKHIIKHSQDNPFQCDVCGKGFSDRRGVRRHSLIHTGEAQFTCVLCSRAFLHSYHLSRHMKTHRKKHGPPA